MTRNRAYPLVAAVAALTCARSQAMTDADFELSRAAGIPDSIAAIVRAESGAGLGSLRPLDSLGNFLPARGVAIAVAEAKVNATLGRLQARLGPDYIVLH